VNIGVTSSAAARAVGAAAARAGLGASVVPVPVRSSWAELLSAQEAWNDRLAPLFEREEVSTAIDPTANAVRVQFGSKVPAFSRAALERESELGGVNVEFERVHGPTLSVVRLSRCRAFAENKAYCDPTIASGVTIRNERPFPCTAGPAAIQRNPTTSTTETFLLTAGHCTETLNEIWSSFTKAEAEMTVGEAVAAMLPWNGEEVDLGLIKVEGSGWVNATQTPVNAAGAVWSGVESEPLPVSAQHQPEEGDESCHSGQTTGKVCGTITAVNLTLGPPGEQDKNLVEVPLTPKASFGDSGGPFYSIVGGSFLLMEGTTVGNIKVGNVETNRAVFSPLSYDFERLESKKYNLELLTILNETRPKCPMPGLACFKAESFPTTLKGEQVGTDSFTVNAGTVKCTEITYSGTLNSEAASVELAPTYGGCTAFGFVNTPIDPNGCKYRFNSESKVEADKVTGSVDVVCPESKKITITAFNCEVGVASQTGRKTVTYTDTTAASPKKDIDISVSLSGLAYSQTSKSFPGCSTGSFTNGTYKGETTLKGASGGGSAVGIEAS